MILKRYYQHEAESGRLAIVARSRDRSEVDTLKLESTFMCGSALKDVRKRGKLAIIFFDDPQLSWASVPLKEMITRKMNMWGKEDSFQSWQ